MDHGLILSSSLVCVCQNAIQRICKFASQDSIRYSVTFSRTHKRNKFGRGVKRGVAFVELLLVIFLASLITKRNPFLININKRTDKPQYFFNRRQVDIFVRIALNLFTVSFYAELAKRVEEGKC